MSEHWGSHNIEKDIEVTPGKTNSFDTLEKEYIFRKIFLCFYATSIFQLHLFFYLLYLSV